MDYRSRILAAIDALQMQCSAVTVESVAGWLWRNGADSKACRNASRELRAMHTAGIVAYDRKASGWRRA